MSLFGTVAIRRAVVLSALVLVPLIEFPGRAWPQQQSSSAAGAAPAQNAQVSGSEPVSAPAGSTLGPVTSSGVLSAPTPTASPQVPGSGPVSAPTGSQPHRSQSSPDRGVYEPCEPGQPQALEPAQKQPEPVSITEEKKGRAAVLHGAEPPAAKAEERKPDTIIDVLHAEISKTIQGTATWVDSFFGDVRYESELNESYVRVRYNVFKERDAPLLIRPDFTIRMVLPQLKEKTHLIFAGTPKEISQFSPLGSQNESGQLTTPADERKVTAAVEQTVHQSVKDSFLLRAGLQLHKTKPVLMLGPRYRLLIPLGDNWNLRFVEEVVWRSNTGWDSRATTDIERPLPHGFFFRATNEWVWTEHVLGYLYAVSFTLSQALTPKIGLSYEWVNLAQTRPINELTEVQLRVKYRQSFWRDWLFFDVSPQYRFPRTNRFHGIPGILFGIEVVFGSVR